MTTAEALPAPIEFFPAGEPRPAQVRALDFVRRAYEAGYRDVVVEAPTGSGKSFIASALALWGQKLPIDGISGGYVLVNQKLLQDQMAADVARFRKDLGHIAMIKSAVEYTCPIHKLCSHGGTKKCALRKSGGCPYRNAKAAFVTAPLSITNYAYFFTERTFIGDLQARRVLCLDECHNLAKLLIRQVDVKVSTATLEKYAVPDLAKDFAALETLDLFLDWMDQTYLPAVRERAEVTTAMADGNDAEMAKIAYEVMQHYQKSSAAVDRIREDRHDWIYWQEKARDGLELNARPLEARPFFPDMVAAAGALRVYFSAFPGTKRAFCRELGLDPGMVAWISLASSFPLENRPVYLTTVGSLSKAKQEATLPSALRMLQKILDRHPAERGVIHSHSYAMAEAAVAHLGKTPHAGRLLFPRKAEEREAALATHKERADSVLISPSVAEGFDFKDDLARFQVLMKCVDSGTMVLTTAGLKTYRELTLDDTVFGLNKDGELITQPILKIIHRPEEKNMISYNHGDIVVTPGHRMLVMPKRHGHYNYVPASVSMIGKDYAVPRVPKTWIGKPYVHDVDLSHLITPKDSLLLTEPKIKTPGRRLHYLKKIGKRWRFVGPHNVAEASTVGTVSFQGSPKCKSSPISFPAPLLYELIGWFAAEGHIDKCRQAVVLTQVKTSGVQRLESLLTDLHLYHSWDQKALIIRSRLLVSYLSQICPGKSRQKYLDRSILESNYRLLRCFLDGALQGDGHVGHDGSVHYYTSSPHLCWQICEVALKLGYAPNVSCNDKLAFTVRFNTSRQTLIRHATLKHYSGEAFCLTTPSSNFLAARNGKFFFTGNCPYPSLSDKQVEAKLERDRSWYEGETLKTILQACGRIVRSETDHGSTYILDEDAARLLRQHSGELPRWFTKALIDL
jgi:Rad3-related DNA helicase